MRKISLSQAARDRIVHSIKKNKPHTCGICLRSCDIGEAAHIFPKGIYGHYYTEPKAIMRAHHDCHVRYDDSYVFRSKQTHIIEQAREFATTEEIFRHFGV